MKSLFKLSVEETIVLKEPILYWRDFIFKIDGEEFSVTRIGDLLFEISAKESYGTVLVNDMPVGGVDVFLELSKEGENNTKFHLWTKPTITSYLLIAVGGAFIIGAIVLNLNISIRVLFVVLGIIIPAWFIFVQQSQEWTLIKSVSYLLKRRSIHNVKYEKKVRNHLRSKKRMR